MIYKRKNAMKRVIDESFSINDIYPAKDKEMNLVMAEINGFHGTFLNHKSKKYYFILEGDIEVMIGNEWFRVEQNDFVEISTETKHALKGKGKLLIICTPSFDATTEEIVKE
jgi:mannose-6-phosphate isomerase-like protein (cupin superfamily)